MAGTSGVSAASSAGSTGTGTITSGIGVATGLNTSDIITKLMAVDRVPLDNMTQKQSDYKSQISAYGDLSSALSTFRNTLYTLKTGVTRTSTASVSQTSAKEDIFTASVSSAVTDGNYSVSVDQLATSQRLYSPAFAGPNAPFNAGSIRISVGGNTKTIQIDRDNYTLSAIKDSINKSGADVTATISRDNAGYRLVLSANNIGAQNKMRIITTDEAGGVNNSLDNFSYDLEFGGGMKVSQEAQDAQVTVDGRTLTSATNKIVDAVAGITMDLKKTSSEAVNLSVSKTQEVKQDSMTAFVAAYNTVMSKAKDLANTDTGVLKNDGTLDSIVRRLKSITTNNYGDHSLAEMGITHDKTGAMQFDGARFTNFTAADSSGFYKTIGAMSDSVSSNIGAMISSAIQSKRSSLTSRVSRLDVEKADLQASLDKKEASYRKKFSALETIVSQLKAQGDSMTSMLSGSTSTSGK
jgi:flagellar hook-associated protein 2